MPCPPAAVLSPPWADVIGSTARALCGLSGHLVRQRGQVVWDRLSSSRGAGTAAGALAWLIVLRQPWHRSVAICTSPVHVYGRLPPQRWRSCNTTWHLWRPHATSITLDLAWLGVYERSLPHLLSIMCTRTFSARQRRPSPPGCDHACDDAADRRRLVI